MSRHRRRIFARIRVTGAGLGLVAAISFIAGMTDAVGLSMTGDFVSFMTGNTTRAALSVASGDSGHAIRLFSAVLVFVAGNALGIIIASRSRQRVFTVLATVSLMLFCASLAGDALTTTWQFLLVVLAMGVINAAVEHIGGLPIGLTYVTGALSRLGRGIGRWILGERRLEWTIQIVPWAGMVSGALCGALLAWNLPSMALWAVASAAMLLALVSLLLPRSLWQRYNQRLLQSAARKR